MRLIKRPEPEILRQSWRPIITHGNSDNGITQVSQIEIKSVTNSQLTDNKIFFRKEKLILLHFTCTKMQ